MGALILQVILCAFMVPVFSSRPKLKFSGNAEIIKEFIEPLILSCFLKSFNNETNEHLKVHIMFIQHETNGVISTLSKDQAVAVSADESSTHAHGKIYNKDLQDSYLQVIWKNPKISESGKYFCLAYAKNSTGQDSVFQSTVTIKVLKPKADDLVQVIGQLLKRVDTLEQLLEGNETKLRGHDDRNVQIAQKFSGLEALNLQRVNDDILISTTHKTPFTSCRDVNSSDERVVVTLASGQKVMCDTKTDGGGWIIIQRRIMGYVDFYRGWKEYRDGFGDYNIGEFYLGNENIHQLTSKKPHELRIDLEFDNENYFAQYSSFLLLGEEEFYKLQIGDYSGNAGDSLAYQKNMSFSTYDRDNDNASGENCAVSYSGAWWYNACHMSNLNGDWGNDAYGKGVNWDGLTGLHDSVVFSEMKLRELD
ncbi:fibrinogen-like protein 1 isoform X1 [Biomphalaria glabrata]|uniref:Fibrinogen-like protein 1 isoform X1 n=3 Tax=Biomphalaria glabrata TaxID=6526 RepID=A0A9W2YL79_BIOGL|nr:fibrinogen-like protein 1 isoform X1 [Biomphalaria glabrata]